MQFTVTIERVVIFAVNTKEGLKMEWISVKDKLPSDTDGHVLICYLEQRFGSFNEEIGTGYYDSDDFYEGENNGQGWLFWLNDREVAGGRVTHWMPLPELPKAI